MQGDYWFILLCIALAPASWFAAFGDTRRGRTGAVACFIVMALVVAGHWTDAYVRGYWRLNAHLVPVTILGPDGNYRDGTHAGDDARRWSHPDVARELAMWCLYAAFAALVFHRWRQAREERKSRKRLEWLRTIGRGRPEDGHGPAPAGAGPSPSRRGAGLIASLVAKGDSRLGRFRRETTIERYCREGGWLIVTGNRVADRYWIRRPGGGPGIGVLPESLGGPGTVTIKGDFAPRFPSDCDLRDVFAWLATRNEVLEHAAWSMCIDHDYQGYLGVEASVPQEALNVRLFDAVCREVADEVEACQREFRSTFRCEVGDVRLHCA